MTVGWAPARGDVPAGLLRLARIVVLVLAGLGALASAYTLSPLVSGDTSGIGQDINAYLGFTRQWLDTGSWYLPEQLAGAYVVEDLGGNVYPPTLLYLTVPFALGVPYALWWAIPIGVGATALYQSRPARWGWLLVALLACYPRTWIVLFLGNPSIWSIAFALAGVVWGWPAVGAALKLTFAPLALAGIRHRRAWLVGLAAAVLLALPFGSLWLDYVTVLGNTESSRGLTYVLGEWPIAIGLVVAAFSGRPIGRAQRPYFVAR